MYRPVTRHSRRLARFASVSVVLFAATGPAALHAQEFDAHEFEYPDFSYALGLELNGDAKTAVVDDESVLRIVPAMERQSGTFFYNTLVPVTAFHTQFSFRCSEVGGIIDRSREAGGDGFVFTIQPINPTGGGHGVGGSLAFCDFSPSVGVEFDTYNNSEHTDVSTNHVGVDKNGSSHSHATVDVADRFDNGKKWFAWIDYDGTTLEVRANQTGVRPTEPLLSYEIDIPATLDADSAYVGFTAATGCAHANHDILSWRFEESPPRMVSGQPQPPSSK
jgi:hypothetical protein